MYQLTPRLLLAALSVIALSVTPTAAQAAASKKQDQAEGRYSHLYYSVKHAHGPKAPGRNIRRAGVVKKHGKDTRPATMRELKRSSRTLYRMLHPPAVVRYLNPDPSQPRTNAGGIATLGATSAPLSAIAACESGGNPRAIGGGGAYRGKYQFDYGTWASVGGSGDPAAAPEAEQDRRAAMLYAKSGSTPWPVCGH